MKKDLVSRRDFLGVSGASLTTGLAAGKAASVKFEPADLKPDQIYCAKEMLEADHPEMVSRAAMVRTADHKLVLRPGEQNELYDVAKDPRELHNVYGDHSYASAQQNLLARLLHWYVLTADVAPRDKDPRGLPPFYPTPRFKKQDWHREILD